MKKNFRIASNVWQRDVINGARVVPQGYKLDENWVDYADALKRVKELSALAKKRDKNFTYNVSGTGGNYCVLCYTGKSVPNRQFVYNN